MLYFDPPLIAQALKDMANDGGVCAQEFAYPVLQSPHAAQLFRTLYQAVAKAEEFGDHLKIEETLALLLEHLLDCSMPVSSLPEVAANRAKALIDDNPQSSMSLALLAREADLSRFQLVRAFTHLTGLTPHAYLLQRRIHRTRQLIAAGMPLVDASLASGFADQSHMTRCFVRSFGFSPGMYARKGHP
ncbi:transcriptional regulator, AraC family [Pseudomonas ogarae]|nr:transcriptional regulator, AraC family [Pseudomonas ogarae]